MEEIDDDSKVRRNLVVVSAVILIFAWLDLPFSAFIDKFVDPKYAKPDLHKLWALGLAVLAYVGLRYRFSAEGARYDTEIKREILSKQQEMNYSHAQGETDFFTKTGREPAIFSVKLSEIAHSHMTKMDKHSTLERWGRPKMFLTIYEAQILPWNFSMTVSLNWTVGDQVMTSPNGQLIEVRIAGYRRIWIRVRSMIHIWGYSASSINYLVPVLLSFLAVLTILVKIHGGYSAVWDA